MYDVHVRIANTSTRDLFPVPDFRPDVSLLFLFFCRIETHAHQQTTDPTGPWLTNLFWKHGILRLYPRQSIIELV